MSKSIFQQFVDSINKDYENTYTYVNKNFQFIRELINKIALHIDCTPGKDICIVNEEGVKINPYNFIQDAIIVEDECFFSFKLLISPQIIKGFNINSCGKSFAEKGLLPPSGIIMYISVKQENEFFIVKAPLIKENEIGTEIFQINSDESWNKLLESIDQVIIRFLKKDLNYRISHLSKESSQQAKPFGFIVTPETKTFGENVSNTSDNNDV